MKRIKLKFDNTISGLAGFDYGKEVFEEQVFKDYHNFEEHVIFVFPVNISRVAYSFVQGFFYVMIEEIGIDRIKEVVDIESDNGRLKNEIFNRLE